MNRLQKKCLIVSGGLHGLLVLLVVVGPGFMSSKTTEPNLPEINFVPSMLVDAALAGGGNPNARQAPAAKPTVPPAPVTPPPPPAKAAAKAPEPEVVEPVRTAKAEADSLEASKPKKPVLNIPTKLQSRSTPTKTHKRDKRAEEAEAQEAEERAAERQEFARRQQMARMIANAANSIRAGSSATSGIEDVEFGPGGGGPTYASLAAWIQRVYEDAWVAPENTAVDTAVAYATITIARDGSVVSATLTTNSGDSQVDASVRRTLERVRSIGKPFPDSIKDKERTYKLKFDLKAKRQMA